MGVELRCKTLHGIVEGDVLEVKCSSRVCGAGPGRVVLHRFNVKTGQYSTHQYKTPEQKDEV